jgi:hypothetical protein
MDHICATCGRTFIRKVYPSHPSPRYCSKPCQYAGRRSDAGMPRPARRTGEDVLCETCGVAFYKPKNRLKSSHHFCSVECLHAWQSETKMDEITVVCSNCGIAFTRKPRARGKQPRFCGAECRNQYTKQHPQIASHSGGQITRACAVCGKHVTKCRSLIERRNGNVFCSKACHGAWISKRMAGENCNFWKGGFDRTERTDWECNGGMKWKRNCKKRDNYACQLCGKQLSKLSRGLHVHHKAGFTEYPTIRSEPCNGVCLCEQCHDWTHSNAGRAQREAWEAEALAELAHLLPKHAVDAQRQRQPALALEVPAQ